MSRYTSDLPAEILRQLFEPDFESGSLRWKARDLAMFANERAGKIWNTKWAGKPVSTHVEHDGYARICVFDKRRLLHRVIWALATGEYPEAVDHINGNRADNRLINLRAADNQTNSRNRSRTSRNTSGEVGVSWKKCRGRWEANVYVDRKRKIIGTFREKSDAVAAVRAARAKLGFHENHGRPA